MLLLFVFLNFSGKDARSVKTIDNILNIKNTLESDNIVFFPLLALIKLN